MQKLLDLLKVAAQATVLVAAVLLCVLFVNLNSAVKRADAAVSSGSVQVSRAIGALQPEVVAARARLNVSLDNLDAQVAAVGFVVTKAGPVLDNLASTETKLGAAVDLTSGHINDLCPLPGAVDAAIHPCGSLADFNRSLATFRGTSGQVEKSLRMFNSHESDLFAQEHDAYAAMDKSVTDFDGLVSDPDLKATIGNGKTISGNLAVTSGNFATMTTDGKDWLHLKLYPTKKQGLANGFDAAGDRVHHWMPSIF
jgi:hypothetical protein